MASELTKIILMNLDQMKALVAQGESHHLEFKKSTGLLSAAFETVCAFLNSEGGTVLIGVTNEGRIVGQEVTDKVQQTISTEISKLEPPVKIEVSYVPLDMPLETDKRFIIALHVKPGSHKPYVYEGRPFQREQTVTKRMPQQYYDQLLLQRPHASYSWERLPAPGYTIDDLDQDLIQGVVRKAVETKRMPEIALKEDIPSTLRSLELMTDDHLCNAAIALFGKKMIPNYSQCHLQLARFKGTDRSEFMDIDDAYGNTFELLEKGLMFVRKHLPLGAKIIPGQLERVETLLIPFEAVREALYNTLCHRDYSIIGGSIGIAIYDDRMEIFSHGGLPPGATLPKIKVGFSKLRNPVIANVFFRSYLIERWGRGIQKIINSCVAADDPEPEFFADEAEFKVIFRFPTSLKPPVYDIEIERPNDIFDSTHREIMAILARGEQLSTKDILARFRDRLISERTLRNELSYLEREEIVGSRGHTNKRVWFLLK